MTVKIKVENKVEKIDVLKLFKSMSFSIPYYQRKYSWDKNNCKELFEDILEVASDRNKTHFFSSLTLNMLNEGGTKKYFVVKDQQSEQYDLAGVLSLVGQRFYVVDGQQRLTTLSLLICALNEILDSNLDACLKDVHELKLHFEDPVDQRTYRHILKGFFCEQESLSENMIENFKFFKAEIDNHKEAFNDIEDILRRLLLVKVLLPDNLAPQKIFERMNGTKLEITQMDLIKNFLLMKAGSKEEDVYKKWEADLKDAQGPINLMMRIYYNKNISDNELFSCFKGYYNEQSAFSCFTIESMLNKLPMNNIWSEIDSAVEKAGFSEYHKYETFRLNHGNLFRPLIYKIMVLFKDEQDRRELIRSIVVHVARSIVVNELWKRKFNGFNHYWTELASSIDEEYKRKHGKMIINFFTIDNEYKNQFKTMVINKQNEISDAMVDETLDRFCKWDGKHGYMLNRFGLELNGNKLNHNSMSDDLKEAFKETFACR